MSFLEEVNGLPPGPYTPEFLEIDKVSGPWLLESQQKSPAMQPGLSRWELDPEEGVMWLGDEKHNKVVAAYQVLATYTPDDKQFLWAWANERFSGSVEVMEKLRDDHPEVAEFVAPFATCTELGAWTLAAAAAHKLGADVCYRIPGEVQVFVALFEVTRIEPGDPRYLRPVQDPKRAQEALAEYAGATAMAVGGILMVALKNGDMNPAIDALYRFSDKLAELGKTPVGAGTPAAAEADALAVQIRQLVVHLSYPPEHPDLLEGVGTVLGVLEEVARRYGAWPGEHADPEEASSTGS